MHATPPEASTRSESDLAAAPVPNPLDPRSNDKTLGDIAVLAGLAGDAIMVATTLFASFWLQSHGYIFARSTAHSIVHWTRYAACIGCGVLALLGCFEYYGIYRRQLLLNARQAVARVTRAVTVWLMLCAGLVLIFGMEAVVNRECLALSGLTSAAGLLAWRWVFHRFLRNGPAANRLRQRVVLLGWTPEAGQLASQVWKYETDPYEIVGYVDLRGDESFEGAQAATLPYLSICEEVSRCMVAHEPPEICPCAEFRAG